MRGFSSFNLWLMRQIYLEYSSPEFLAQAAPELEKTRGKFLEQAVPELVSPAPAAKPARPGSILEQVVQELVAAVPWGHHVELLKKVKGPASRLYYLRATAQLGWSRSVLLNQIKAGAYERAVRACFKNAFAPSAGRATARLPRGTWQALLLIHRLAQYAHSSSQNNIRAARFAGCLARRSLDCASGAKPFSKHALKEKKTHNFALALPEHLAEQADEMLKSSYNLEFLGLGRAMKERELEDRLISHLQRFILELGYGFCFIGRQHRLAKSRLGYRLRAVR